MKLKVILAIACFTSLNAMAQYKEGSSQARMKTSSKDGSKGVVVGLVYTNLTDSSNKYSATTSINGAKTETSDTNKYGIHAGFYGLNLGYKNLYVGGSSMGFNAAAQILKPLNASEVPQKVTLYKILGDFVFSASDMVSLSAGLNVSYFDKLGEDLEGSTIEPGVGGQLGVEIRLNQVSVLIGTQAVGLTQKYIYRDSSGGATVVSDQKNELFLSGFITQLSYTF